MLHRKIINGDVVLSTDLTDSTINEFNQIGLTALQLATREGHIATVLKLINAGALVDLAGDGSEVSTHQDDSRIQEQTQKTPYYLALENGHVLVAQILLAHDASKQKAMLIADKLKNKELQTAIQKCNVTETVKHAMMCWEVKNANPKMTPDILKKLQQADVAVSDENKKNSESKRTSISSSSSIIIEISELSEKKESSRPSLTMSRLIEFAAYSKQEDLMSELLKLHTYSPDPQYVTAGFFSNTTYDALINNNDHTLMTLQQLREAGRNDDDFVAYYAKASSSQQDALEEKSMPALKDLSSKQKLFYNALRFSHLKKITAFKMEDKDYYAVLKRAALMQDLCVVDALAKIIPDKTNAMLTCALHDKCYDLAQFWLILNDMDPYQFVVEHLDNKIVMGYALQSITSKESLLQQVCSIGARRENKMTELDKRLLKLLTNNRMPTTRLLQCLHDHVPNTDLTSLIKLSDVSIRERCEKSRPRDAVAALMNERFQRMGYLTFVECIKYASNNINPLTLNDRPLRTIISFLDPKEQEILEQTTRICERAVTDFRINLSLRKKLQHHLDVIAQCEEQLTKWIDDQWGVKGAPMSYWGLVLLCAIFIIGTIVMLALGIYDICTGKDFSAELKANDCSNLNDSNRAICGYMRPLYNKSSTGVLLSCLGGFFGGVSSIASGCYVSRETKTLSSNKSGRLQQNIKIDELPRRVQARVLRLHNEVKDSREFIEINGQSTIGFVLSKISPVILRKSEELKQIPEELNGVKYSVAQDIPNNNMNNQIVVSMNGYASLDADDDIKKSKEIKVELTSNKSQNSINRNNLFNRSNVSNSSNDSNLKDPLLSSSSIR